MKLDKSGNKVSMLKPSNEVDKVKVTKENNISLPIYSTDLFPSGMVNYSDKNYTSLMIESEDPPPPKNNFKIKWWCCVFI